MTKQGPTFKELGFRTEASASVKRAFIKHLITAADRSSHQNSFPILEQKTESKTEAEASRQLSFDANILKASNE